MRANATGIAAVVLTVGLVAWPAAAKDDASPSPVPTTPPVASPTTSPSSSPSPSGSPSPTTSEPAATEPSPVTSDTPQTPAEAEPYEPLEALPDPASSPAEHGAEEGGDPPQTAEEAAAALLAFEKGRVSRIAAGELERARERLAEVQTAWDAAVVEAAAAQRARAELVGDHDSAVAAEDDARRRLGNFARQAYAQGPTEWTLVESMLDASSPGDALRRAQTSRVLAERQNSAWNRTVEEVAALNAQDAEATERLVVAAAAVRSAMTAHRAIEKQIATIEDVIADGGMAGPDGTVQISRLCRGAEVALCKPSGLGEGQMTRDAVWLMRAVKHNWPQIETVGGFRTVDRFPDHPSGRAVDVMVPDAGRSQESVAVGDEIAQYFMENADRYGVMYLIWQQRVWVSGKDPVAPPQEWRMMADRGDRTSNHMDHVHITVSTGVSGSDIYQVLAAAGQAGR